MSIIKGKRGASTSEEEPRPSPAQQQARESALIKNRGGVAPVADPNAHARRSSLMKRGTYTHSTADEPLADEPPAAPAGDDDRISIPTGDRPPAPSPPMFDPSSSGAQPGMSVGVGPPVDQQILEEAKRRAEAIVRQAQLDAKKLLEESKIHCQAALQQAEKDGFELGQQKGFEASTGEMAVLILQVRQMLSEMVYGREKVLRSAEGQLADLALKIAERVIQTAVTTNPEVIKNQVTQALDKVKDREHITLRVNPQDLDVVRARRDLFNKMLEGPKTFEISGDPKVDRGGVIIETNLGNVDARVSTQLQAVSIAMNEVEKRMQPQWEAAAQEAARQVLEQGLPPHIAAQIEMPAPPPELIEAYRQQALEHLKQQYVQQQMDQAAQQAAWEAAQRDLEQAVAYDAAPSAEAAPSYDPSPVEPAPVYAPPVQPPDDGAQAVYEAPTFPGSVEQADMTSTFVDGGQP